MLGKCGIAFRFLTWIANRTPTARELMTGWNRKIQFMLDGESPFSIQIMDGRMERQPGETTKPDLVFISDSDKFFLVMTGGMKFDQGFSSGAYTMKGSIVDAVRLMRIAELAQEAHPTLMSAMRAGSRLM